ncbi:hypothetical protein ACFSMW_15895 [Virgibacillus halophilus]
MALKIAACNSTAIAIAVTLTIVYGGLLMKQEIAAMDISFCL